MDDYEACKDICKNFVEVISANFEDLCKKPKIHLILHLADCMVDFGPTSGFNTER